MVKERSFARTLGNIRADAVGCPDHLLANGVLGKWTPALDNLPDPIRQRLRKLIDPQGFKMCPSHNLPP
jgi:hypothetical protein